MVESEYFPLPRPPSIGISSSVSSRQGPHGPCSYSTILHSQIAHFSPSSHFNIHCKNNDPPLSSTCYDTLVTSFDFSVSPHCAIYGQPKPSTSISANAWFPSTPHDCLNQNDLNDLSTHHGQLWITVNPVSLLLWFLLMKLITPILIQQWHPLSFQVHKTRLSPLLPILLQLILLTICKKAMDNISSVNLISWKICCNN